MVAPFDRPPLPERVIEALLKVFIVFSKVIYVITYAVYLTLFSAFVCVFDYFTIANLESFATTLNVDEGNTCG